MKIAIFQTEGWEVDYLKNVLESAGHKADFFDGNLGKDTLPPEKDYEAISVFVGSWITKEVIDFFPNLKLITTRSTGFDHINLKYAKEKGIICGYVPNYGENTVAEFAMGLILTLSRKLYWSVDRIKRDDNFSYEGLEGFDLKDKTLGVIGAGKIGRHLIKMAKGFNMNVIAYDRNPNPQFAKDLGFEYKTMDEVLSLSDIISLHVFYAPETHHLINMDSINKIKKGAILINTARGPVVDTKALVLGLQRGVVGGAGLDVLEEEGILKDEMGYWWKEEKNDSPEVLQTTLANHVLMRMPNVIITPHNAFNTKEAVKRILDADIENIKAFTESGKVKYEIKE